MMTTLEWDGLQHSPWLLRCNIIENIVVIAEPGLSTPILNIFLMTGLPGLQSETRMEGRYCNLGDAGIEHQWVVKHMWELDIV